MSEYQERISSARNISAVEAALHMARYSFASGLDLGTRVLDCACGTGYGSALLASSGTREVVGVDVSDEALAEARERVTGVRLVKGNAERLETSLGTFSAIVSFETIEHIADPDAALASFHGRLAESGLLIISTPNAAITSPFRRLRPANRYHMWEQDPEGFRARLGRAGFSVTRSYGQAHLRKPVRLLYQLARARGQIMCRGLLRPVDTAITAAESRLVRLFQGRALSGAEPSHPCEKHPIETYVYQLHLCKRN